jgi:hypothetical protein
MRPAVFEPLVHQSRPPAFKKSMPRRPIPSMNTAVLRQSKPSSKNRSALRAVSAMTIPFLISGLEMYQFIITVRGHKSITA